MANALFVAWRSPTSERGWLPVGRLEHDGGVYRFVYTHGARTLAGFRPFVQMEDLEEIYESDELLPVFANRLLSKRRPEYDAYLKWGGFDPSNPPDPISILGVTEGRRQTDSIEVFPCPEPDNTGCYVNKFFVHGLSFEDSARLGRINQLAANEELYLMAERHDYFDAQAVLLVDQNKFMIGYVPRYLAGDIRRIMGDCTPDFIHVFVERVNKDAPLQQRLLCRMNACWPDNFRPCDGDEFRPIPTQVPERCDNAP